ncbi:nucleoside phosphatase family-domain-containing protein [Amylostereum chailletii]|nr:nucleoside phosphatase family-domain-containing protein [Amylostereum chailletii]
MSGRTSLHRRRPTTQSSVPPFSSSSPIFQNTSRFSWLKMLSPRSSSYERLEGGMGPGRLANRRPFAWKKCALAAVVVLGVVWIMTPSGTRPTWTGPASSDLDLDPLPPPPQSGEPHWNDGGAVDGPTRPSKPDTAHDAAPALPRPTSFESDPDPLKTVHCTVPHTPGSSLVQWALMIDAGSTGSRIHVYKFHNCGPSPTYEYEVFQQTQPGLSDYASRPKDAAESLDPLLQTALRIVPEALRTCTPVAVKATAGLRLLDAQNPGQSGVILDAVRSHLETAYPFPVSKDAEAIAVMDGKDEGVYAWITANYLLNTIRADSPKDAVPHAVLDLGGASTQIVFEPAFGDSSARLLEGEHKYELEFGGRTHVLYQHSYLGYGLKRARKSVHRLVEFMASVRPSGRKPEAEIANPCLARGTRREVEIEDELTQMKKTVTMAGEDVGGFEACNRVVELIMAKDAICEVKPCSFDGVYQPSLLDTFPAGKILLLSYFYDRIQPLVASSTTSAPLTIASIAQLATDVCQGRPAWERRWAGDKAALDELEDRPEYCLDLTFMHGLLRLGYEFGGEREVGIGKQIEGTELGWALGAAIAMVGGELTCKA